MTKKVKSKPKDPETLYCVDCDNFYTEWVDNYTGGGGVEFRRCKVKVPDPVMGGESNPQCLNARYLVELCGPKAKWFKPREDEVGAP